MVLENIFDNTNYRQYLNYLAVLLSIAIVFLLVFFGYKYYKNNIEKQLSADFAELIVEYDNKIKSDNISDISDLEQIFKINDKRYVSSKLYPYFLSYKANVLLRLSKTKEVFDTFSKLLNLISKDNPVYYNVATKFALLKLDYKDMNLFWQDGYDDLINLSQDLQNPLQDMAIYYLSVALLNKYNIDNNIEFYNKAKELLQKIVYKNNKSSIWYNLASSKLDNL